MTSENHRHDTDRYTSTILESVPPIEQRTSPQKSLHVFLSYSSPLLPIAEAQAEHG